MHKHSLGKAVFLDRDGVINEEVNYLHRVEDLRILPGVIEAVKNLNEKGYRVVVVSNQAMIAKRIGTHDDAHAVNRAIEIQLAKEGAKIDAFYFCPHHPDGTREEYAIACACRKPNIGMLEKAAQDLDIDFSKSFLVGDATSDILAGKRAGLRTILVKTGYGGSDKRYEAVPDFIAEDLFEAVEHHIL